MKFPRRLIDALREATPIEAAATVWCPHEPTAKQARFLAVDALEALYGGAAGGGKSDALLMDHLRFVDAPKYSGIIFRKTYTDLALPGAIMDRAHQWLAGTSARWNDRDKKWSFPSGATLAFGYMDGPRDHYRYQSAEFQRASFDELTQFERSQYLYMFSRLRRTDGNDVPLGMRCATNPGGIGHDWVKERFLDAPEGRVFIPATLDDNPFLNADEYDLALSQLDPVTRQQLREGLWVRDTSGLVYYCWSTPKNTTDVLPALRDPEETWSHILACDFGVTDPTAFVELAFTPHDPRVFVTRSEQWPGLSPSEAAEICRAWDVEVGGYDRIIGDVGGLGKGFEAEWRHRFRIPLHAAAKTDKLGYIKLLNGDLHRGLLMVLPGNEDLIRDLQALAWKDEKHAAEHPAMPNHLPDALLYGWRECRHWEWEERAPVLSEDEQNQQAEDERFEKRLERNAQKDDDEWILGPE